MSENTFVPTLLSVADVQRVLNISRPTAYKLISDREIGSVRIGPKRLFVEQDELERYIASRRRPAKAAP
jgi:excisionase family DNA binding protein